jgi:hypothetical protein
VRWVLAWISVVITSTVLAAALSAALATPTTTAGADKNTRSTVNVAEACRPISGSYDARLYDVSPRPEGTCGRDAYGTCLSSWDPDKWSQYTNKPRGVCDIGLDEPRTPACLSSPSPGNAWQYDYCP